MNTLWSHAGLIESLQRLAFFERAFAHVLAGWIPKAREFSVKLGLGQHLYESLCQAYELRRALLALGHKAPTFLVVPQSWPALMAQVDALPTIDHVLTALYLVVKARLITVYRQVLAAADPLYDAQVLQALRTALPQTEGQYAWAVATLRERQQDPGLKDTLANFTERWHSAQNGSFLSLDEALWLPLDRVPSALRPEGLDLGETGAMPPLPLDSLRDPAGIGLFLHNNINEEYTTLELVSRNSYEHPDLPWTFHLAMARQAADEARHARVLERLAAGYGVRYGDYPISVATYDLLYQFAPCPPGSLRELLWRLLLRSTYQEGLAIDDLAYEVRKRQFLGQPELARAFNYILVDEIFHVENGLKWSRLLSEQLHLDVLAERDAARDYYLALENHSRLQFIVRNPERAIAEAQRLQAALDRYDLPFARELNVQLRTLAGFSDAEIQQVRDWGIYPERSNGDTGRTGAE